MSRLDQWVEPCGLTSIESLAVILPPQTTCGVGSMTCERDVEEDEAGRLDEVESALRHWKEGKLEYALPLLSDYTTATANEVYRIPIGARRVLRATTKRKRQGKGWRDEESEGDSVGQAEGEAEGDPIRRVRSAV